MTVIVRRIIAEPIRTASETWKVIINLLTSDADENATKDLKAVTGVACSLIASEAIKDAPIVVYGAGPRVRLYCLYGEEAITGDHVNESKLATNPLNGDWKMSIPCLEEDIDWVQAALKKLTFRITARNVNSPVEDENEKDSVQASININLEAFF